MKRLLLAILLLPTVTRAQNLFEGIMPMRDGKINYTEIITLDSTSKDELYMRGKKFIVSEFNSGKDVIQIDDKESGELIGKGYFDVNWNFHKTSTMVIKVWFQTKLSLKNNRARIQLTDIFIEHPATPGRQSSIDGYANVPNAKEIFEKCDTQLKAIIAKAKMALKQETTDNW